MSINKFKIGVVNLYNFPSGLAATTRIIAYCKGLRKFGCEVEIISISPKLRNSIGNLKGECDGGSYFHFAYSSFISTWGIRSVINRILRTYCHYRSLQFIKQSHSKRPYDAIILSFDEPYLFRYYVPEIKKMGNLKLIAIADEYPVPIRKYLKPSIPESKLKQYRHIYRDIDARILMTEKLKEFYDSQVSKKPTLILSTIVDTDRFSNLSVLHHERIYMCYMGNMELSKDNVDNIIKAFSIIKDSYPSLDFYLYGEPSASDQILINKLISELKLKSRVFLKGKVDYSEVPSILYNAKLLVTSQPNTKRAEGGFPTKMGEYFMTGKPTILTNVGEITNYVTHKVNAYMVEPENPSAYAETIRYVLNNYEEALQVAAQAKKDILSKYSCDSAGKNIVDFINRLD